MSVERLQKIMARAGFGSRRASEQLIAEGRVTVNGQVATLGTKADPDQDKIIVNGSIIKVKQESLVYIALNKPRGVISTSIPQDRRKTVMDMVDVSTRLFTVGRLDQDSEGLMLLTNDGELANHLTHPRYGHEKEYRVLINHQPDEKQLSALRHGIVLEDGHRTMPARVWVENLAGKDCWLGMAICEGRNRQIREMCQRIGLPVLRLIRMRISSLKLGDLKRGEWRYLTSSELKELRKMPQTQPPRFGAKKGREQ
ncbi:MAG: pseudouridine synthase [Chloroflexota bacterium]